MQNVNVCMASVIACNNKLHFRENVSAKGILIQSTGKEAVKALKRISKNNIKLLEKNKHSSSSSGKLIKQAEPYIKQAYAMALDDAGTVIGTVAGGPIGGIVGHVMGSVIGYGSSDTVFNKLTRKKSVNDLKSYALQSVAIGNEFAGEKLGRVISRKTGSRIGEPMGDAIGLAYTGIIDSFENKKLCISPESYGKSVYQQALSRTLATIGGVVAGTPGEIMGERLGLIIGAGTEDSLYKNVVSLFKKKK